MSENMLSIKDKRTGKQYEVPIENGTISAMQLRAIKVDEDDFGIMSYDPGFKNTASTKSTVTYLNGEKGILQYRGYPIEEIAENASFLETAYLILFKSYRIKASWMILSTRSPIIRCCMKTPRNLWKASAMMPIRWECWSARSPRSRRSIRMPKISTIRKAASCKCSVCWAKHRPSLRTATAT